MPLLVLFVVLVIALVARRALSKRVYRPSKEGPNWDLIEWDVRRPLR